MKNINIDNGKITINTTGYNAEDFAVPVAQTQAQTDFEYVEPVSFKDDFGNPFCMNVDPKSFVEDISIFRKKYDTSMINPLRGYFLNILNFSSYNTP